jgi:hypothetical protein
MKQDEFLFKLHDNIFLKNRIYTQCIYNLGLKKINSNENLLQLDNNDYKFLSNCYSNYINNYKIKINNCDNFNNSDEYDKCLKNTYDDFNKSFYSKTFYSKTLK